MARGFQTVEEQGIPPIGVAAQAQMSAAGPATLSPSAAQSAVATQMLLLALKSLSQRALVALSSLFTAAALFSAWWLWSTILPNPTVLQLVGVGMYALFLCAIEILRRRTIRQSP